MSKKVKALVDIAQERNYPQLIQKEVFEKASQAADRVLRLYPKVPRRGTSFVGAKKNVVPNQSLTLKEILKRFVRKEALAVGREGIYNDSLGDLEKMQNLDITEQMDIAGDIKSRISDQERKKKAAEKEEADKKAKAEFEKAVQDAASKLQQSDPGEPGSKKV